MSLRRRVLHAALSLIVIPAISGCGLIKAFTSPGPTYTRTEVYPARSDTDTSSTCSQTGTTQFQPWTRYTTNDNGATQTGSLVNLYYYAPTGSTKTLYVYTGSIAGTDYAQPVVDAINSWFNAETYYLPDGHYMRLQPGADTTNWQDDLVQMSFESEGLDYDNYGQTYFGVVNGAGSVSLYNSYGKNGATSDGSYIAGSQILFHSKVIQRDGFGDSTSLYRIALHELGHAQGLDHNPERGSIMYLYAAPNTCYNYGKFPVQGDVTALINHYDPIVNADERQHTCTAHCALAIVRRQPVASPAAFPGGAHPHAPIWADSRTAVAVSPAHRPAGLRTATEAMMRSLAWYHGPSEAPVDVRRLSARLVSAASGLVVEASPIRTVASHRTAAAGVVIRREYVVSGVLSDALASVGEHPTRVGDHVFVDEAMAYEDVPFADDPPVAVGQRAVLNLDAREGLRAPSGAKPVFRFTAPLVSKWVEDASGRLSIADRSARVASDLRGRRVAEVFASRAITSNGRLADPRIATLHTLHTSIGENLADIRAGRGLALLHLSRRERTSSVASSRIR